LLCALRTLVLELHPEAVEVARPGDRAVSRGKGERKMTQAYAFVIAYKSHVNFGFYRGDLLVDSQRPLTGTGKSMRHVALGSLEDLDRSAPRSLLKEAIEERRTALRGQARSIRSNILDRS
jgi:hypothetical protein